ncbi:hypothetical protein [Deinococcus sp. Leaf326]|uniref:hypothetical protein n=1 Tax=Deinococcus sp. Leaf326 TaxID=1736338 RepID=UPI000A781E55|nr:hypothetical protein [Deinococcus sp. Leaf326]
MPIREGELTAANFLETAPETAIFINIREQRELEPQDIAKMALRPLPTYLPESVLFFLRRGVATAAYSGFYYPLVTVALGQLGLAVEEAIRVYAKQHDITTQRRNGKFKGLHELLVELGKSSKLTPEQQSSWQRMKAIRNLIAHPDGQMIASFAMFFDPLEELIDELVLLFPEHPEVK